MKTILIFIFLTVLADDVNRIAAINRLKKEAETAYENANYQEAVQKYSMLVDSLNHKDEKILLNFSNACFKVNDTTNAKYLYNQLTSTDDPVIKSRAYQQLGIMANNQQKYSESLHYFKSSLRADPGNEDSRYNYELLKKMMQNQPQQDQQNQQNQDQENKEQQQDKQQDQEQEQEDQNNEEQQNQDQQDQQDQQKQQEEKSQQEQEQENEQNPENENQPEPQKLEDMKISEEMAKKILEAMRNNEIQYLQQQRRKPTKPRDSGKPDW
jgi:Ca-activated chloride channel homolog